MPGRSHRSAVLALLVVALLIRIGAVAATPNYAPVADPADYERYALAIEAGHFPGRGAGIPGPTAYRPPLYPVFLGAAYRLSPANPRVWSRILQALLGVLAVWLTRELARELFGRRVALCAMAIAAAWPSMWLIDATSCPRS